MTSPEPPSFRIAAPGGEAAAERVRSRVADRFARGLLDATEVERVKSAEPPRFSGSGVSLEAFRNCCLTWEIDRAAPISSHRPIVGPILVAVKRAVRRALRYQSETFLQRQRDFNWNLLLVLREVLERDAERR